MTQANLLERAKQGDPESIATLINMTLQPKGITATAQLTHHCLHVFLTSERILNQATMASFVLRGLQGLDVTSIQTARIYGQKLGDSAPVWVEEIVVNRPQEHSPIQAPSSQRINHSGHPSTLKLANFSQRLTDLKSHLPVLEEVAKQVVVEAQTYGKRYWHEATHFASQAQLPQRWLSRKFSPKKYGVTLAIATMPAFLLGAVVAIIASYANNSPNGNTGTTSNPSATQLAINSAAETAITTQQNEVRKYLAKMNKVQQDFYQKNNRFAASLEELERSTSTISLLSTTRGYTYKLTTPDNTYSLLTAVPREDGFKSFTGVVFLDDAPNNAIRPITTICETSQPSKTPPETPRSFNGVLQCPPGSSKSL